MDLRKRRESWNQKSLFIAPPHISPKTNPTYWPNMTEASFSETLAKWRADSRLKRVCQRPLCRLHALGNHASGVFRRAIKMFSHDELSDSMIQACDNDADRVHGLTIAPLTKEEIDYPEAPTIAYMVKYVENHMVDIQNDPTQQERPECSRTTENHLVALGNSNVFFPCCWKLAIYKVINHELDSNGLTKDKDTFSDMTVAIRLDEDLRRWLISIDYIKPNADETNPREKDAKTKKPKVGAVHVDPYDNHLVRDCIFKPFQTSFFSVSTCATAPRRWSSSSRAASSAPTRRAACA